MLPEVLETQSPAEVKVIEMDFRVRFGVFSLDE